MPGSIKDLLSSYRVLTKNPGLSSIAVIAFGLGIGLTAVMFSIVYGAMHRGLPFEGGDRLMHLERSNLPAGIESMEVTVHDFYDWKERQRSFEDLAAFDNQSVTISGVEHADRFRGAYMTANAMEVISAEPIMGRGFQEGEDRPGTELVALIGHHVWQSRYGGDPAILGQAIKVNGELGTIIGIMPDGFRFPVYEDIWLNFRDGRGDFQRGRGTTLEVFGKLRDGISLEQVRTEFEGITQSLASEFPGTNEGVGALIKPYTEEFIEPDEEGRILYTMLVGVFFVLLIACANVANLLLARAATRTRDLAVRTAMGASRFRIVGHLLTESLVLAGLGAALGLVIAWFGIDLFNNAVEGTEPPYWLVFTLDTPILLFVVAVTVLAALAAGVFPAFQASSSNLNSVLKDESRGASSMRVSRLSKGLVVAQVAFSVGLLAQAGLMVKSVYNLGKADFGFPTEDIFTASVQIFDENYSDRDARQLFFQDLERGLASIPGTESFSLTDGLPGMGSGNWTFGVEGVVYERDQDYPSARHATVGPEFFETFELAPITGRVLERDDLSGSMPVTVVNESFARTYFPNEDPLGRRIRPGRSQSSRDWITIVGVVPDAWMEGLNNAGSSEDPPDGFYTALAQEDPRSVVIAIRSAGDPLQLTAQVREIVNRIDPEVAIVDPLTLSQAIDENLWFIRVFGLLFLVLGLAALFLASVGLYGVMSFSVSRRTQEVGIRMALGAQGGEVLKLIMRQGGFQIGIGIVLGLGLAIFLTNNLTLLLFLVEPLDPWVFTGIVAVLGLSGLAACLRPALKATRVEPVVALRYE